MAISGLAPVSVVIPAYNAECFVGQAIASVLAQTYKPSEIIVVNDGSTDRTADRVAAFVDVRLASKQNGGPGSARNFGLQHATQPLVAFLDADDLWTPRKLERQIEALRRSGAPKFVFGKAVEFRELDAEGAPVPLADPVQCQLPGALLGTRAALDAMGPFREDRRVGDVIDWYARALDSGVATDALDEVVLLRRLHENNLGRTSKNPSADYLNVLRTVINRRNSAAKP